ncbi:hypothetical protein C3432_01050 [Citrobacter amalonaticus]|uniref:Uncharacterized protein n=1 Tax=Citrobacter amalonaticus TaxID=35703 RepID=A0A2S4S236_CITAM|nr:hypothetical protein C3432_01050 [Citrobacter amalonaticus]POT77479.1 hypothetical protein C3436_08720 [Citrobacter amalonaticus]POU67931.1 hypothetical protein C3430_02255 [Citrobacter amalonaticus]POV07535.1 hypothetical protein C3424_02265 [Citrobacter amalonaticus]
MSQLNEKRRLLYWKFCRTISPVLTVRLFPGRALRILTKNNKKSRPFHTESRLRCNGIHSLWESICCNLTLKQPLWW